MEKNQSLLGPTSNSNLRLVETGGLKKKIADIAAETRVQRPYGWPAGSCNQTDLWDQQQQRKSLGIHTEKNLCHGYLGVPLNTKQYLLPVDHDKLLKKIHS